MTDVKFKAFIHTVEIITTNTSAVAIEDLAQYHNIISKPRICKDGIRYKVNPHKIETGRTEKYIYDLNEYKQLLDAFLNSLGIEYKIQRIDICFNTVEKFENLYKLNTALIWIWKASCSNRIKNDLYYTNGAIGEKRNIKSQSGGNVATAYNKEKESNNRDEYNTRIEFRLVDDIELTFEQALKRMEKKLNSMNQFYDAACKNMTNSIIEQYSIDTKAGKDGRVIRFTEFITKYADYFFSHKIFSNVCKHFSYKHPNKVLYYYKSCGQRTLILYTAQDIQKYVDKLKIALKKYQNDTDY